MVASALGVGDDARIGGEDAVDVGVDLADVGLQRGGQRDGGGVRAAAAERGDVLGVLADPLEAGDQHDRALGQRLAQPVRVDLHDPRVAVLGRGDHAGLRAGERAGLRAERVDGHRDQRVGDPLTRGEQHVHLARRRRRGHLLGEVEQLVGGVAHGRHDHDDVVALLVRADDPLGDLLDPVRVLHGRSAVLLHDEGHRRPPVLAPSARRRRPTNPTGGPPTTGRPPPPGRLTTGRLRAAMQG